MEMSAKIRCVTPALVFGQGLRRKRLASVCVDRLSLPRAPLCRTSAGPTQRPAADISNASKLRVLRVYARSADAVKSSENESEHTTNLAVPPKPPQRCCLSCDAPELKIPADSSSFRAGSRKDAKAQREARKEVVPLRAVAPRPCEILPA